MTRVKLCCSLLLPALYSSPFTSPSILPSLKPAQSLLPQMCLRACDASWSNFSTHIQYPSPSLLLSTLRCPHPSLFPLFLFPLLPYSSPQLKEISRGGQAMIQRLEDSGKPVVAAIHGSCLGGGMEVGHNVLPISPSPRAA